MRKNFLCLLACLACLSLAAQEESVLRAAQYLSGALSVEEIPADWIERVETARRVRVNAPDLRAGVFLSDYQVACIEDYRARSGDILSLGELALVDGFTPEVVAAIGPFLSLESSRLPGAADTVRVRATALARTTLSSVGFKGKVGGASWRAGGAIRGDNGSFYGEFSTRFGRVLAGTFQTRWGQGLAAWSGFSMESLSTVDAFVRRATGLSPVWSYAPSGVQRGVAYEYASARIRVAAFGGPDGWGGHVDYLWRNGQVGFTYVPGKGAVDFRYNTRGVDLVGEVATGGKAVAVKSALRGRGWALQGRIVPRNFSGKKYGEYGASLGLDRKRERWKASLTADAALLPIPSKDPRRFQLRVWAVWQWLISPVWTLDARFTERYRNYEPPRTDFRADVKAASGPWLGVLRMESVRCGEWGFLGYLEGGYKGASAAAYLRMTGFSIPVWAARIYCYERDAAGTFSVPAYNGRGIAASLVSSCKFRLWHRLTLRGTLRAAAQWRIGYAPAYTLNAQLQCDL